ncbi:Uncharacterised protein [Xylophilus ampelinus]|nr:Uncharacterised protein [Xylophilus ampelinus]
MDCLPLHVVEAAELGDALKLAGIYLFGLGVLGVLVGNALFQLPGLVSRMYRLHRAKRSFAERAHAVEDLRQRMFLRWNRIALRNARERARVS